MRKINFAKMCVASSDFCSHFSCLFFRSPHKCHAMSLIVYALNIIGKKIILILIFFFLLSFFADFLASSFVVRIEGWRESTIIIYMLP